MAKAINNTDDVIDSRDVIERIAELTAEWAENTGDNPADFSLSEDDWAFGLGEDDAHELVALMGLAEEGETLADWKYGETLIHDSYFEDYAEELAHDCGMIESYDKRAWPLTHIDWVAAAEALQQDYTELDFDGQTYWARA